MNKHTPNSLPDMAILHYGDGDYAIVKSGKFVLCAVSGKKVPLEALKYWNPITQEAFAGPQEAMIRWKTLNQKNLNQKG